MNAHRRTEFILLIICLVYAKIVWNKFIRLGTEISKNSPKNPADKNNHLNKLPETLINDKFDNLPKSLPENYVKLVKPENKIKSVMIVAEYRTGSSFFSEIFNQHPKAIYLYEPMSILKKHCDANPEIHDQKMNILTEYHNHCHLPWSDKFITREKLVDPLVGKNTKAQWSECLAAGLCNRERHDLFQSERFCPILAMKKLLETKLESYKTDTGLSADEVHYIRRRVKKAIDYHQKMVENGKLNRVFDNNVVENPVEKKFENKVGNSHKASYRDCPEIDRVLAKNICKNASVVVSKMIRLCRLVDLTDNSTRKGQNQVSSSNSNINPNLFNKHTIIFYLVRDPRGIINSRLQLRKSEITKIPELCIRFHENLKYLLKNPIRNVRIVRYEDLALKPFDQTKKLLIQAGLEFSKENIEWLNLHTNYIVGKAAFGTSRDAVKSAFAWRHSESLNFTLVEQVQNYCGKTMTYLGYNSVGSDEELGDDKFYTTDPGWNEVNEKEDQGEIPLSFELY